MKHVKGIDENLSESPPDGNIRGTRNSSPIFTFFTELKIGVYVEVVSGFYKDFHGKVGTPLDDPLALNHALA